MRSQKIASAPFDKESLKSTFKAGQSASSIELPIQSNDLNFKDGQYSISITKAGRWWGTKVVAHSSTFQILNAGAIDEKKNIVDQVRVLTDYQLSIDLTKSVQHMKYDVIDINGGKTVVSGYISSKDVSRIDTKYVATVNVDPSKFDPESVYFVEVSLPRRGGIFGYHVVYRTQAMRMFTDYESDAEEGVNDYEIDFENESDEDVDEYESDFESESDEDIADVEPNTDDVIQGREETTTQPKVSDEQNAIDEEMSRDRNVQQASEQLQEDDSDDDDDDLESWGNWARRKLRLTDE